MDPVWGPSDLRFEQIQEEVETEEDNRDYYFDAKGVPRSLAASGQPAVKKGFLENVGSLGAVDTVVRRRRRYIQRLESLRRKTYRSWRSSAPRWFLDPPSHLSYLR